MRMAIIFDLSIVRFLKHDVWGSSMFALSDAKLHTPLEEPVNESVCF